ncbi:ribose-phosphate pyrophosphokinase [Butyrivibrio sp. DSM 10294]|uniref:ribose-phosphate pyrophosphokinase n=1 Tax=Butyrivibrio sp. DSM 10294 TaxID=2972457 RepID=UPI00234F02E2|nr:ribose-phosphate pyrophosphokinase [Butyrivibrio sp. DSM 10294]MDC7294896.1 ribose-phosphate pyrophosphokinase [Butyrivibrio sp. DSM 10294]
MSDRQLGIIALESYADRAKRINQILCGWRKEENFLIEAQCPRFASGEAKGVIGQSVRDKDIYILVDVCNNSLKYKMDGELNRMSPDDHYQDLKRVIAACNGKAERITVVMPFLYESRQHRKTGRESLDCAVMLKELEFLGVDNIVTFDAHDPRMQNVLPLNGIENISPALQFTQAFLTEYEDIQIDSDHLMFIAPDEGATERVVFFASIFGVNLGMFYKRRDYANIVDGTNPIIAHDFCGGSLEGMDAVIVDDMIASGGSIIDVCKQIKERGARRIFVFSTFGLFSGGFAKLDRAYEEGLFDRIFTTNLVYQKPELLEKEYYCSVSMNHYIAAIIDTLNKSKSMQNLTKPADRMKETINAYMRK